MKKILTADIVTPVKQPFTRYSLEHIQQSYTELMKEIAYAKSLTLGENGNINKLRGLDQTVVGASAYTITSGSVIHTDGTILLSDGMVQTITSPKVPVCYLQTTYISSDPLEFSDGTFKNVHQINKLFIEGGTAGSGGNTASTLTYLCDFSALGDTPTAVQTYPILTATTLTTGFTFADSDYNGGQTYLKTNYLGEKTFDLSFYYSTQTWVLAQGWNLIGTLPTGFRPSSGSFIFAPGVLHYDSETLCEVTSFKALSTGQVYMWSNSAITIDVNYVQSHFRIY